MLSKLQEMNFTQSAIDQCIFMRGKTIIFLYVDDLLVASETEDDIDNVYKELASSFSIKDLGNPKQLLGIEILQGPEGVILRQPSYTKELLAAFRMNDCKPCSTPMENGLVFEPTSDENKNSSFDCPYRSLLGGLQYLACCTRPDIAVACSILGQFSSCPSKTHWKHLKRILRYLKGTTNHGIIFKYNDDPIVGYCDANWEDDHTSSRSRSGLLIMSNGPTHWRTWKQKSVALSSMEAEFYSISEGGRDIIACHRLNWELENSRTFDQVDTEVPIEIFEDNQATINHLKEKRKHKLRHIRIRYHWIQEQVERKVFRITYIPTKDQLADFFTKALGTVTFISHRERICFVE